MLVLALVLVLVLVLVPTLLMRYPLQRARYRPLLFLPRAMLSSSLALGPTC